MLLPFICCDLLILHNFTPACSDHFAAFTTVTYTSTTTENSCSASLLRISPTLLTVIHSSSTYPSRTDVERTLELPLTSLSMPVLLTDTLYLLQPYCPTNITATAHCYP
jgi:hypothetical protein